VKTQRWGLSPAVQIMLHDVGLLLHVPGMMALSSLPICLWFREFYAIPGFLITAALSLGVGQLLYRLFATTTEVYLRHAMMVAAASWGLIPLIGAIPFWFAAVQLASAPEASPTLLAFQDLWNAVFESVSGFTSTGLTVAQRPSQLPYSLQWWRSFSEWIGGVGVIVLLLSIVEPSTDAELLYSAEGRQKQIARTVTATVRRIWWIYLLYSGLSILLLRLAGMPWWDAINHGLTGISTGGFSIRDDSLGSYSPLIQLAAVPIMITGAISFPIHACLLRERRLAVLWQDTQHRTLWLLLMVGTLILLWETYELSGSVLWLDSLFQWVSALGTCGFETVDLQDWSPSAQLWLTLAMIIGGAAGSTVGGLKLNRAVTLYKAIRWRFQRLRFAPDPAIRYRLDGKDLSETEAGRRIESAATLAILWLLAITMGVFVLLHVVPIAPFQELLFEAASALGSVGLSTGVTSPDLPWLGKLVLILLMWLGRLEIIPVLVLLRALVRRPLS